MPKPPRNDNKDEVLRDCGALNTHPVVDALFHDNEFFDPRDLVQVKYEMLRRVCKEGESISRAATSFGFSRPSFYKIFVEFKQTGIAGLLPRKRGPRARHKITAEVLSFVKTISRAERPLSTAEVLGAVEQHFGVRIHRRSLERALRQAGKKTPGASRKDKGATK